MTTLVRRAKGISKEQQKKMLIKSGFSEKDAYERAGLPPPIVSATPKAYEALQKSGDKKALAEVTQIVTYKNVPETNKNVRATPKALEALKVLNREAQRKATQKVVNSRAYQLAREHVIKKYYGDKIREEQMQTWKYKKDVAEGKAKEVDIVNPKLIWDAWGSIQEKQETGSYPPTYIKAYEYQVEPIGKQKGSSQEVFSQETILTKKQLAEYSGDKVGVFVEEGKEIGKYAISSPIQSVKTANELSNAGLMTTSYSLNSPITKTYFKGIEYAGTFTEGMGTLYKETGNKIGGVAGKAEYRFGSLMQMTGKEVKENPVVYGAVMPEVGFAFSKGITLVGDIIGKKATSAGSLLLLDYYVGKKDYDLLTAGSQPLRDKIVAQTGLEAGTFYAGTKVLEPYNLRFIKQTVITGKKEVYNIYKEELWTDIYKPGESYPYTSVKGKPSPLFDWSKNSKEVITNSLIGTAETEAEASFIIRGYKSLNPNQKYNFKKENVNVEETLWKGLSFETPTEAYPLIGKGNVRRTYDVVDLNNPYSKPQMDWVFGTPINLNLGKQTEPFFPETLTETKIFFANKKSMQ